MLEFLKTNWSDILAHLAQHVWLVFISIAIAVLIALPVGILITRRKRLRAPVLGIAVVITIGVAIIAAEVGAGGLGEYIFRGLRLNDNNLLLAGAVPSASMALVADFGFGVIEKRFDTSIPRRRTRSMRAIVAIAV